MLSTRVYYPAHAQNDTIQPVRGVPSSQQFDRRRE